MPRRSSEQDLTINELAVLGFGYARSFTDSPEFTSTDMFDAIAASPYEISGVLHPATFARACGRLSLSGAIIHHGWTNPAMGSGQRPRHRFTTSETATEPLLHGVTYAVTHKGLTLPEILLVDESIEAILEHGEIEARVQQAIFGEYKPSA